MPLDREAHVQQREKERTRKENSFSLDSLEHNHSRYRRSVRVGKEVSHRTVVTLADEQVDNV